MKAQSNHSVLYVKSQSSESFEYVDISTANNEQKTCDNNQQILSSSYELINGNEIDSFEEKEGLTGNPAFLPVNHEVLETYFDTDGRLVQEAKLREAVFNGGCDAHIRKRVWSFMFSLYPMVSTKRERKLLDVENYCKYQALKTRCNDLLCVNDCDTADEDMNETPFMYHPDESEISNIANIPQDTLDNHKSMAKIYAGKQSIDLATVNNWYRVIEKDVPRTDIDHPYFHNARQNCLAQMKNILVTFGFFHPKIGYVQGMNDILTHFLIVLDSEVDAYWCFSNYMESVENDFDEDGMVQKIDLVCKLLQHLEPNLYSHFCACSVPDLVFCHRWLLVSFKREFDFDESIRYFEIVHSQHLKLDSPVALSTQDDQSRLEVMKRKGKPIHSSLSSVADVRYTLDVFVCVSVIMLKRQAFLACTDASEVFDVACNIRGSLNLQEVHKKARTLFFKYCRRCVEDQYTKGKDNIFETLAKAFGFKSR